ncbi:MAG: hypothetical protein KGV43_03550 [Arcobacter sp.]|nr:hypothetical protein [Arcobacter sp.]
MERLKIGNGKLVIFGTRPPKNKYDEFSKITMEFLINGCKNYEKILYISLSSPKEIFEKQCEKSYGFRQDLYEKIIFVVDSISFDDIKYKIENSDAPFIVIDYVQLIAGIKGIRLIEELKNLAKKTKKTIMGYVYVDRRVENRKDKIAKLNDFRYEDIDCADGIFYMYKSNDILHTIKKP